MSGDAKFALLDGLAEEFAQRRRRGEHPALADYIQRFPELAEEIRDLFPAIAAMELAEAERHEGGKTQSSSPCISQVFGDYRILREIGRGGMGIVYEAEQQSLGRRVALKVLPERIANHGKALARFRREARGSARLHHTNIVPVFEVGQERDVCFYAMQFIQGQALDQVLDELRHVRSAGHGMKPARPDEANAPNPGAPSVRRVAESLITGTISLDNRIGPSSIVSDDVDSLATARTAPFFDSTPTIVDGGRASAVLPGQGEVSTVEKNHRHYYQSVARIGLQTASALAYAHARGVIHRDVKPSNLLLDASGVVWVADFGLAKSDGEGLTEAGDVIGTFRYMAPERFKGEGDARADVYALGLTLYEMLALRPAFDERDRVKLMERVQHEEPPRLRSVDPRIPRDLETIVLTASDKDPRRRYQSADAMADDLRRFLADEPIAARRASVAERFARLCRRNPLTSALSMSVLALIATTAVVASLSSLRLGLALDDMKKAKSDATDRLWGSYLAQARATQMSRRPGQSFDSLRVIREAMKLPIPEGRSIDELRNEAVAAILLPDLELEKEWSAVPSDSSGFDIDDRFERYAVADREGTVRVLTVEGDKELCTLPKMGELENYRGLKFSPDGTMLGQWNRQRVRLWRLADVEKAPLLDVAAMAYCFSPDGKNFVVADKEGEVRVYETQSAREIRRFSVGKSAIDIVWNPKLPQLLVGWKEGWAVWNVEKGELLIEKETIGTSWWFAWHPNGRWLASDPGLSIHLWDASTGRLVAPPTVIHRAEGVVFRFDRTGDRLVSNDWTSVLKLWDVRSGRRLLSMPARTRWFKFHRDDDRLVYATTPTVRIFRYRSGEAVKSVQMTESDGRATEVVDYIAAPTNRMLAVAVRRKGTLYEIDTSIVDLDALAEVARLPIESVPLLIEPDARGLLTFGKYGLLRWPITPSDSGGRHHRVGPPKSLSTMTQHNRWGVSSDGSMAAVPNYSSGAIVWRKDGPSTVLAPQHDVRFAAIDPSGRFIATGTHHYPDVPGVKVWNASDGKCIAELPVGGGTVTFSPDGRWLATNADGGRRFWRTGSWTEGPQFVSSGIHIAFHPNRSVAAIDDGWETIRLLDLDAGRELTRLTAPVGGLVAPLCFTPDGTKLVVQGVETLSLFVIDVAAVRHELAEMGLDWSGEPLPTRASSSSEAVPLKMVVETGDFGRRQAARTLIARAQQLTDAGNHSESLVTLRKAVEADPNYCGAHNNLAWQLLTGPTELRNVKSALVHAEQAVKNCLDGNSHHNTLGLALLRNGRTKEAIAEFEESLRQSNGRHDAHDLFALAICHRTNGDAAKAADCLRRGEHWLAANRHRISRQWINELEAFQAEAKGAH